MTNQRALWGLVIGFMALRLGLAACLGPSNDEAYYSLFAIHRDWSYFDHPPMVGILVTLGSSLSGWLPPALALRLPFIALFAVSTFLVASLAARLYGARAGFPAALALNAIGFFGLIAGTFALPDGPLLLFWLLTLDRLAAAIRSPERLALWLQLGLAWGGALLSKYHAIFLPLGACVYLLFEPTARRCLRIPGPYLALVVGLVTFSPVLWWNATHHWASFAFQGGRALGEWAFHPDALALAVAGQAAYLLPWFWVSMLAIAGHRALQWSRGASSSDRFLLCQAAGPLAAFTAIACFRPVLPHWSLVGFLSLVPMLGANWACRYAVDPRGMTRRLGLVASLTVALALVAAVQTRTGILQRGGRQTLGLVPASCDPTLDLFGWDQVAAGLRARGLIPSRDTFLFTCNWYYSGQLAFATNHMASVLCYNPFDARGFAYWSQPRQWVGRDGILVALDNRSIEPACFDRWFSRIEPIGEFPIVRAGAPVHHVRLFRCVRQLSPFPVSASERMPPRRQVASRAIADGSAIQE